MLSKAERRKLLLQQMVAHEAEQKLLSVYLATGNRVVLWFAGAYVEYWFHDDEEPVPGSNNLPLEEADEVVLKALADNVYGAVRAGYRGSSTSSGRKKVAPRPVKNRRRTHRLSDALAARETFLYHRYQDWVASGRHFHIVTLTGSATELQVGNASHRVEFVRQYNQSRLVHGAQPLSREWFSFLCVFGRVLLKAADVGYKSTNPPKQPDIKGPTPRHDLRQTQFLF